MAPSGMRLRVRRVENKDLRLIGLSLADRLGAPAPGGGGAARVEPSPSGARGPTPRTLGEFVPVSETRKGKKAAKRRGKLQPPPPAAAFSHSVCRRYALDSSRNSVTFTVLCDFSWVG